MGICQPFFDIIDFYPLCPPIINALTEGTIESLFPLCSRKKTSRKRPCIVCLSDKIYFTFFIAALRKSPQWQCLFGIRQVLIRGNFQHFCQILTSFPTGHREVLQQIIATVLGRSTGDFTFVAGNKAEGFLH